MTDTITTVDDLTARLSAARTAGDRDMERSLVDLGALWAMEADLDIEFSHDGINWDAPDEAEVSRADALAEKAMMDRALLLMDPAIEAEYRRELQGQHYQALRAERRRQPSLADD
ncbi:MULTISPECIES: hypothetical protein [Methylobacterium]|uniref:Uncharacterized protein n=2 Tax=Methylobacterium TaxID=407 RepID=A0A0C6FL62_9HYPH|nr:hypothetical protein [Methylobacterium aquaticum]QRE77167.1 hypothetical protein F1D61_29765 [Methylobacterium aquaticum]BAQ45894.1 hypothetical protein Maq22A_c13390 [Methylobacterium aquaticum]